MLLKEIINNKDLLEQAVNNAVYKGFMSLAMKTRLISEDPLSYESFRINLKDKKIVPFAVIPEHFDFAKEGFVELMVLNVDSEKIKENEEKIDEADIDEETKEILKSLQEEVKQDLEDFLGYDDAKENPDSFPIFVYLQDDKTQNTAFLLIKNEIFAKIDEMTEAYVRENLM